MKWTRSMRIFLLLAFAGIAVSTAGALFALHPRDGQAADKKEKDPAYAVGDGMVCYGYVDVIGGFTPLVPLQSGRVAKVEVDEGDPVCKDDVLLRLDSTLAEQRLREAHAELTSAEAQLRQTDTLEKQHLSQVDQQEAVIEAAVQRAKAAEQNHLRKQKQGDNAEHLAILKNLANEAQASVKAERKKLEQLLLVNPKLQVDRAKAETDAKRARRDQAQYALDQCLLKAPEDGEILQVHVSEGSVVAGQSGPPAILFVPSEEKKPRIVRAEVEQEHAHKLKLNQTVEVRDEARRTDDTWKGKIKRIANYYDQRRGLSDSPRVANNDVHVLEFIVELDPKQPTPLRMGQRVRVVVGKK